MIVKFFSTQDPAHRVSFKEAVLRGLAPDRGLYFPMDIPRLPAEYWRKLHSLSNADIGFTMMKPYAIGEIPESTLHEISISTLNFEIPLVQITPQISCLELFHGPTLAFKDVGARFMGRILPHCVDNSRTIVVLVATSGDTGAAVAHGFYNQPDIRVVVLYPRGKVSSRQERQMACLGRNVSTLAIDGDFDDCQMLVKTAFLDSDLNEKISLTSANSINIARWLPQSIYYAIAARALEKPAVFCVPSGNYGNITAGMLAEKMGLQVSKWVSASNANDVVPVFLAGSPYQPRASVRTLANAMDVGDPSNFIRLMTLYGGDQNAVRQAVQGISSTDQEIKKTILKVSQNSGYLLDPHTATGYRALELVLKPGEHGIVLGTAHPAKFADVYHELGIELMIPERLTRYDDMPILSDILPAEYDPFREYLQSKYL